MTVLNRLNVIILYFGSKLKGLDYCIFWNISQVLKSEYAAIYIPKRIT